jgi:hypothetical protein
MQNQTDKVLNLIHNTARKIREAEVLSNKFNIENKEKFLATHLLDYVLTQVSLETLKDFKEYRGKGWV